MEVGRAEECDKYRYRMNYPCMGTCLIINNKNFKTGLEVRNGTDEDVQRACRTFEALGYKVKVFQDQTRDQMLQLMNDESGKDHRNSSSFVCVLMSHGREDGIYGTDKFVELQALTTFFKGEKCESLEGKPKVFFIQACQGTDKDYGVPVYSTDGFPSIPADVDFLYAYSTIPEYCSYRNKKNGTWFIQSVCTMLELFSGRLELMQIMTRVNHDLALCYVAPPDKCVCGDMVQMSCIVSMLTKDFYLP